MDAIPTPAGTGDKDVGPASPGSAGGNPGGSRTGLARTPRATPRGGPRDRPGLAWPCGAGTGAVGQRPRATPRVAPTIYVGESVPEDRAAPPSCGRTCARAATGITPTARGPESPRRPPATPCGPTPEGTGDRRRRTAGDLSSVRRPPSAVGAERLSAAPACHRPAYGSVPAWDHAVGPGVASAL